MVVGMWRKYSDWWETEDEQRGRFECFRDGGGQKLSLQWKVQRDGNVKLEEGKESRVQEEKMLRLEWLTLYTRAAEIAAIKILPLFC
jgi:hypothetical protein